MKVAVFGANGNFGLKHLKAISSSAQSRIVALCDLKFDQALKLCPDSGMACEEDYRKLLHNDFDLAVVSLPNHIKLPVVADLLKAGKHVLVDKPLSLRVSEVRELFSLARKNSACLYVGYNLGFFPSVAKLLELVKQDYFGCVHHVRMFYGHGAVHPLLDSGSWKSGDSSWGGSFLDMGSHLLHLAAFFTPRVETGTVECQHIVSKKVEDNSVALLRGQGCVIEIAGSWTAWRSRFSVEVYGEKGYAELESLVKYIKYGQGGERLRYGQKNPKGLPSVTEHIWTLSETKRPGEKIADSFSADVEYLDQEWQWLTEAIRNKTFDMKEQEEKNVFVADIYERFYAP